MSITSFNIETIKLCVFIVFLISIGISFSNPHNHLIVLPFLAFLSPIAGYLSFGLLFSDIYFLFLTIHIIWLYLIGNFQITANRIFYILLTILFISIISLIIANLFGFLNSLKSLLYLIQLILIYFLTTNYSSTKKWRNKLFLSWAATVILGSILIINSYFEGIQLIDFQNGFQNNTNLSDISYFFRASFFYGGFIFSLGIVILWSTIKLLFSKSFFHKLIFLTSIFVCLFALFLTFNKTTFSSIALSFMVFIFISFRFLDSSLQRKLIITISVFSLITFLGMNSLSKSIETDQMKYLLETISNLSSLGSRIDIYKVSLAKFLDSPMGVLIGMGPDFIESENALEYRKSSRYGFYEGTVDSGFISYFIELGIISFCLLMYLFLSAIKRMYSQTIIALTNHDFDNISLYIFISLIFLLFSLPTQMLGYSKTSWFIFQILIIGSLYELKIDVEK